ncbi:hypothetical protein D3C72_2238460 [compost metagenome]
MTQLVAADHVDSAASLMGQIGELQVIDVGRFDGQINRCWQGFQPFFDGCLVIGNGLEKIQFSLIDHQFILGDIHTYDRLYDRNRHCH